jgi:hypothetical protein
MKKCAYCGRENADAAMHCRECGTGLVEENDVKPSGPPRNYTWIKVACVYIGMAFLAFFLYLLSFGPVARYSVTVISQSSITNANGFTTQRTVQYPRWVGVLYHPAFVLRSQGEAGGFAELYGQYLYWWEKPDE